MDDSGKELVAADIWRIFEREYGLGDAARSAVSHPIIAEQGEGVVRLSADVMIDAQAIPVSGVGTGPIDAFVAGLNDATGAALRVLDYHEHAIGSGADARAVAYLELRIGQDLGEGQTLFGVGIDANIVSASLKAIVSGLSRARSVAKHGTEHALA